MPVDQEERCSRWSWLSVTPGFTGSGCEKNELRAAS